MSDTSQGYGLRMGGVAPGGGIVYRLRAQNLTFVAPMPEQVGILTMYFPEVSGGTYQKFHH